MVCSLDISFVTHMCALILWVLIACAELHTHHSPFHRSLPADTAVSAPVMAPGADAAATGCAVAVSNMTDPAAVDHFPCIVPTLRGLRRRDLSAQTAPSPAYTVTLLDPRCVPPPLVCEDAVRGVVDRKHSLNSLLVMVVLVTLSITSALVSITVLAVYAAMLSCMSRAMPARSPQ